VHDGGLMVAHARIGAYYFGSNCSRNLFFRMTQGSYVPNLVKIGSYITSQSCSQTPADGWTLDGWTDVLGDSIYSMNL